MLQECIDIVYLWVDGSDEIWRAKRKQAYEELDMNDSLEEYANVEGRFRNNNELLYSLRSLEKYFPEHGKIFIVTDNQVPPFLRMDDERIRIIHHKDFMRWGTFPTFSSKNIVSQIPDIPGLSEKFLIMNDDIFLGPDFRRSDFFSSEVKVYFIDAEGAKSHGEKIYSTSGEAILAAHYSDYEITGSTVAHTPKAVIKSDYFEMREEFREVYERLGREIFRDARNPSMIGDLYSRWMISHGKGVAGTKEGLYMETSRPRYAELESAFSSLAFFCINDTHDDAERTSPELREMEQVLAKLFPKKSSFEK